MTAPQLLAKAMNAPCPSGPHHCFFCGGACGEDFRAADHRSDTFTGWGTVARPREQFVCGGCVLATDEHDRARRPRQASWVLSPSAAERVDKSDTGRLLSACLNPPTPPFAIVVALSGQKHLIYLAPVNGDRATVTAQLELERVTYAPADLASRVSLCGHIAAAAGKPSLAGEPSPDLMVRLSVYWSDPSPLLEWFDVWGQPLSRLAAYLTPKMEDARHEYPSDFPATPTPVDVRRRRVPSSVGGVNGPGLFG